MKNSTVTKKVIVWHMAPRNTSGEPSYTKGYWFTAKFPSKINKSVFEHLNWSKTHILKNESSNFVFYEEQGVTGWWTGSKERAESAHMLLTLCGWSLTYRDGLPFKRDNSTYQVDSKQFSRWEGNIEIPLNGIISLLQFPALKKRDRELLKGWLSDINKKGWLNLAQINNLKVVFCRENNLKWLVKKGYTHVARNAAFVGEPMSKFINIDPRHLWAKAPSCCKEKTLLATAKDLRRRGLLKEASKLEQFVSLAGRLAPSQAEAATSKFIKGAPIALDRYYTSCMGTYKDEERCSEVAWNIYCKHINANHNVCHDKRKKL